MIYAKFDLDSTLVDTGELISLALAEQGYMVSPDPQRGWFYEFIEGCEPPPDFQWEVFFYRLLTERLDELKPLDEYVNGFLESIYDGKNPIHVITARGNGVIMHHACMSTLERCFPNVEFHVTIVKSGDDKVRYMEGADMMFEDRRKTALQFAAAGHIVAMPRRTYNYIEDGPDQYVVDIEKMDRNYLGAGDIIVFDDYSQVADSTLLSLISPF
jgi:hypothetical protein